MDEVPAPVPGEIRWDVRSDHIDLDRWAQAIIKATVSGRQGRGTAPTRWGWWPTVAMIAALVLALIALTGDWVLLAGFAPAVILIGGLLVLHRRSAILLAKRLRDSPAASEPFTFVADASGTHDAGATGASQLMWNRYTAVALDEELITLTLDGGAVRVLPIESMITEADPQAVVDRIDRWIATATSSPMTRPGS